MASSYLEFDVNYEPASSPGTLLSVGPGIDVHVREEGAMSDVAESPLTTDSNGHIAAGSLAAVVAGTVVLFRVENHLGYAFSTSQRTT